jgi:hypothetical protein
MTDAAWIKEALCRAMLVSATEDGVRVNTHCLYPSNATVSVVVRGGGREFVVSDEGGALSAASASALIDHPSDKQIRPRLKAYGLRVERGAIYSPPVGPEELPAAILLVANAAKEVADWSLDHLRFREKRDFKAELSSLLRRHFHDNLKPAPILGSSNKPYKFENVVYLPGERRLIVDPVINDPSSINARVVANLDVRMARDPNVAQLIVYDDAADWASSDLKVLEVGAPTVPFSRAEAEISRLAA